ncbi:MAG: N-acetylmuramoyl-L-alanine amidase [Candidatus Zixiibacteriota bacterium]
MKKNESIIFILLISLILMSFSAALASPQIEVVYPREGGRIGVSDSTFIFGSVTPGSKLKINGFDVKVYRNGAFLAFLPLEPGDFEFNLEAYNITGTVQKTIKVKVPPLLSSVPLDTLKIEKDKTLPTEEAIMASGDVLQVSIKGTPGCQAFFKIEGLTPFLPMTEAVLSSQPYWGEGVFGNGKRKKAFLPEGTYIGSYRIGVQDQIDSALVIFKLSKLLPTAPQTLGIHLPPDAFIDSTRTYASIFDTAQGKISIGLGQVPQVVEFIDPTLIARTGPKLGYTLLYQPAGIRAIATGKMGKWVRLRLSEDEDAWVEEDSIKLLPLGTPIPHSSITYIRTQKLDGKTQVEIQLKERLPFKMDQEMNPSRLILDIYYATSNTDWIRYDTQDQLIKAIKWYQHKKDVYRLKVDLNQSQPWGYDAFYSENSLILQIKDKPDMEKKLKGLRICIDPGHSKDPGAVGPTGLNEKTVNLHIAQKLRYILQQKGAEVIMTRYGTEHVPLYDRPKIAIEKECDILISIHNNALPDGVNPFYNNGVSTYYYHPQSQPLARSIQEELSQELDIPDYGLYYANLALTRPSQLLSVLVECAFIILPEQEALLRTTKFQKKIVEAIYKGIQNFIDKQE